MTVARTLPAASSIAAPLPARVAAGDPLDRLATGLLATSRSGEDRPGVSRPDPAAVAAVADRLRFRVEPELAEEIAWRALRAAEAGGNPQPIRGHHERAGEIYVLADAGLRDMLFGDLARTEVIELGLLAPIVTALAERPSLAALVDLALVGPAGRGSTDGVTCDRGRRLIGLNVPTPLFERPDRLLAWCRHAFGHAEDTLDPSFAFEPGFESELDAASLERLHALWDVSVDGRAAAAGLSTAGTTRSGHAGALARLLGGSLGVLAGPLARTLWAGVRPSFRELKHLALNVDAIPAWLAGRDASEADDSGEPAAPAAPAASDGSPAGRGLMPGGRCPLCRFPAALLHRPGSELALAIRLEYPAWAPSEGVCERCLDRAQLAGSPGGAS